MGSRAANAADEVGLPRVLVRSAALQMGFDGEFWSLSSPASSLGRQPRLCIDVIQGTSSKRAGVYTYNAPPTRNCREAPGGVPFEGGGGSWKQSTTAKWPDPSSWQQSTFLPMPAVSVPAGTCSRRRHPYTQAGRTCQAWGTDGREADTDCFKTREWSNALSALVSSSMERRRRLPAEGGGRTLFR